MKALLAVSLVLAVLTSLWTWLPRQDAATTEASKTGMLLTLEGKEIAPDDVTSLRVAQWDTEAKAAQVFEVARKDNVWVIPSKYEYPADGGTRAGATAGGVLNVKRGPLVTADAKLHAELGVVDPLKEGSQDAENRGKRVTLKNTSGATVVDLIVGKRAANADVSYVREASSDEVYTAKLEVDISTRFKDWVETDPLKIASGDIRTVTIKDYSIDLEKQELTERASTAFAKPKDKTAWGSANAPEGHEVNQETLNKLITEVTSLRLTDIVQFSTPEKMIECGLIPSPQGGYLGKEGVMVLGTREGLLYHLFFGNAAVTDETKAPPATEGAAPAVKPQHRYVAIRVAYDPALDETKPPQPPEGIAKASEQEPTGKKKAQRAHSRFLKFFYVVDDASFKKLRPETALLFVDKAAAKAKLPGEKIPKEVDLIKNPSGLEFADLATGSGPKAEEGDEVQVHYTGWLESNSTKFDSSHDRKAPFDVTIGAGGVIKGWDEGLQGMQAGGKRKLVIPAGLGYGPDGKPPTIPGGATLVFDIEVLKLNKKQPPAPPQPEAPKQGEAPKPPAEEKSVPAKPEETKAGTPKAGEEKSEPVKTEAPKSGEAKAEPAKDKTPKTNSETKSEPAKTEAPK